MADLNSGSRVPSFRGVHIVQRGHARISPPPPLPSSPTARALSRAVFCLKRSRVNAVRSGRSTRADYQSRSTDRSVGGFFLGLTPPCCPLCRLVVCPALFYDWSFVVTYCSFFFLRMFLNRARYCYAVLLCVVNVCYVDVATRVTVTVCSS